jgi:clan AA aspartic protease (TIGR02281 family)
MQCKFGQAVTDERSVAAVIAGGRDELCLVKYKDRQTQRWVPATQLRVMLPAAATPAADPNAMPEPDVAQGVTILRPVMINRLVYRADALGHVMITAKINGTPLRFVVDTGATLISLSPEDASAAGLHPSELTFNQTVHTANGPVKAAFAQLREIRIEELGVENVQAAVIENLKQSVLGMSFLRRLKGFDMRDGILTMTW